MTDMLSNAKLTLNDIDGFAVTSGPGSFTGIRIGISAIKGLICGSDKKCVPVSALETIAKGCAMSDGIICAVMDARCNQFYNALFVREDGKLSRLTLDRAVTGEELLSELKEFTESVTVAGDGTEVFMKKFASDNLKAADEICRYQSAAATALIAEEKLKNCEGLGADELQPFYLRLPQAERELKSKRSTEK